MSSTPNLTTETLLTHTDWLRRLAGGLLRDDDAADDAVRNTLASALARPPAHQSNLRGWLGAVLTNHIRGRARSAGRQRRALETAGQQPVEQTPRTPEDVVASIQLQRRLSSALLAIDEPQRQLLYLRYFDELDSPAIAAQLRIPAGTVRWRLKAALEQLRVRLDAKDAESPRERTWRALLVPFAARPGAAVAPGLSAFTMGALAATIFVLAGGALVLTRQLSAAPPSLHAAPATGDGAGAPAGKASRLPAFLAPPEKTQKTEPVPAAASNADAKSTWARLAPFTGVRWRGDVPDVEVEGAWGELKSIDGLPATEIVAFAKQRFAGPDVLWRKRFAEDLVEVMSGLGRPPGPTVVLGLARPDGQVVEVTSTMTAEKRRRVWAAGPSAAPRPLIDPFARLSPFTGLRFVGDVIEVEHEARWHRLISINGITAERLVAFAKERAGGRWRKRIAEDIVEGLRDLGVGSTDKVKLVLQELPAGPAREYRDVPLTEANRRQVKRTWEARSR